MPILKKDMVIFRKVDREPLTIENISDEGQVTMKMVRKKYDVIQSEDNVERNFYIPYKGL